MHAPLTTPVHARKRNKNKPFFFLRQRKNVKQQSCKQTVYNDDQKRKTNVCSMSVAPQNWKK